MDMQTHKPSFQLQLDEPYQPTRLNALPLREKPAYRVAMQADASGCNLPELLAVIIGGSEQIEIAERLLVSFGSIGQLALAHPNEIVRVKGIGNQAALRIKAALALGRKLLQPEEERPIIHTPADAAVILMPLLAHRGQEILAVLALDTRNRVVDTIEVYRGSLNASPVRVCELFRPAIQRNCASVILSHNHPSGDPKPSNEDVNLTRIAVQAGKLLDIDVLDHLVIGQSCWVSLKEKGLGFN
jgi:DNA repair protein RadC